MEQTIRIVRKQVGKEAEVVSIPNTLEALQSEVSGYIEVVHVGSGILLVLNEEGKLEGLEPNFNLGHDTIVGNVFFTKGVGEDFGSLTDEEVEAVINWLG